MIDVKLDITPEKINEYVANSILESSLGNLLKKTIEERVNSMKNTYDNPFKSTVDHYIQKTITTFIDNEFKVIIEDQVRSLLTEELVRKTITDIWEKVSRNY